MRFSTFRPRPEVPPRLDSPPLRVLTREPKPQVWISDDEKLTQDARGYLCPSHGRSPRARVRLDLGTGERVFEGVCCREAEAAIRALQQEPAEERDEASHDNNSECDG